MSILFMVVSKSLSTVVRQSIVSSATRGDVTTVVETSTGSTNGDRVSITLSSNVYNVQRTMFSNRFEYFTFFSGIVHWSHF